MSSSNGARLVYDPLGRLFETSGGAAGVTHFEYDPGSASGAGGDALVAEYNASGTLLRRYMHGPGSDEPILWDEGQAMDCSGTRFLHTNAQGSIIATANCWGTPLSTNAYDEYGIPAPTNSGRFQYTGQTWIPELGMYYYKARFYSPTLGRFMQTDPIGYDDGINWYNYVGGDPVNFRDPSGLACASLSKRVCMFRADPPGTNDALPGEIVVNGGRDKLVPDAPPPSFRDLNPSLSFGSGPGLGGSGGDPASETQRAMDEAACDADPASCITVVAQKGKRNVIHSDHRGISTDELLARYQDPNTSPFEKKRLETSLKGLGVKNIRKRLRTGIPGLKRGVVGPLFLLCALAPVTCGLIDTDGNGRLDADEII